MVNNMCECFKNRRCCYILGPTGPTGATGPTGSAGGPAGATGLAGNAAALTITPLAGGTSSVSAHLVIVQIS